MSAPEDAGPEDASPARVARHVLVRGRVQGVAFRWTARERARELGVVGWVRNLDDGRVEALVEGAPEPVRAMLAWLRHGPPAARVDDLQAEDATPTGAERFRVVRE